MSDTQGPGDLPGEQPGERSGPGGESVGSVGEEAAKLLGAFSEWARDSTPPGGSSDPDPRPGADPGPAPGAGFGWGEALSGLADHAAATASQLNAHFATGSAECTYCPLCRTVHAVRQTSPEVKAHLAGAASSFLQAMAGLLATLPPPAQGPAAAGGVERIDLDDDEDDA